MKKFSTEALRTIEDLNGRIVDAHAALGDAITEYNDAMRVAWEELKSASDAYNESLEGVKSDAAVLAEPIRMWMEDRSEKWQESDSATKYDQWATTWEDLYLEEFEPEEPGELEHPDCPVIDTSEYPTAITGVDG